MRCCSFAFAPGAYSAFCHNQDPWVLIFAVGLHHESHSMAMDGICEARPMPISSQLLNGKQLSSCFTLQFGIWHLSRGWRC